MTQKYIKYTYVDAVTGISVASHPATNGPAYPAVVGLQFVWARESDYPTNVPEFFGTCPDTSDTQIDGVLAIFEQGDWEQMHLDELNRRKPDPKMVGVEFEGVMCSASGEDQSGLVSVQVDSQIQGAAFKPTRFEFANGNTLVLTKDNLASFMEVWRPFRQSFFLPD
jgi:hypothetical protein